MIIVATQHAYLEKNSREFISRQVGGAQSEIGFLELIVTIFSEWGNLRTHNRTERFALQNRTGLREHSDCFAAKGVEPTNFCSTISPDRLICIQAERNSKLSCLRNCPRSFQKSHMHCWKQQHAGAIRLGSVGIEFPRSCVLLLDSPI